MTEEDRVRLRHTDRWVGALVLLALVVFLGALFQRSVLREWFAGGANLTVVLPEEGVASLGEGAEAEVLGIRVGAVRRIIVEPAGRVRAEVRIEDQSRVFIRQDSTATIRRRFGIAGPAYLDISRGQGAPLDWDGNPVIEARTEPAATETAGALLDELRRRIFPVLDDLQRGMHAFAETADRLNRGEGSVGRLLREDTLAREAEEAVRRTARILEVVETASRDVQTLTAALSGAGNGTAREGAPPGSLPALLLRADRTLAQLERVSRDLAQASPALPAAARNIREGTETLPAVVTQAQATARQLELLVTQLRGHWLLGGEGNGTAGASDAAPPPGRSAARPAVERIRP